MQIYFLEKSKQQNQDGKLKKLSDQAGNSFCSSNSEYLVNKIFYFKTSLWVV